MLVKSKIAHCPGHGFKGSDTGAEWNGLIERDQNLYVAALCAEATKNVAQQGLLRETVRGVSYKQRAQIAADMKAKYVFCHHHNVLVTSAETPNLDGQGLMVFYPERDEQSRAIADTMVLAAPDGLDASRIAGTPANPYDWTSRALNVMKPYMDLGLHPVLIEWGFLTHPHDVAFLTAPKNAAALAACFLAGLGKIAQLEG